MGFLPGFFFATLLRSVAIETKERKKKKRTPPATFHSFLYSFKKASRCIGKRESPRSAGRLPGSERGSKQRYYYHTQIHGDKGPGRAYRRASHRVRGAANAACRRPLSSRPLVLEPPSPNKETRRENLDARKASAWLGEEEICVAVQGAVRREKGSSARYVAALISVGRRLAGWLAGAG